MQCLLCAWCWEKTFTNVVSFNLHENLREGEYYSSFIAEENKVQKAKWSVHVTMHTLGPGFRPCASVLTEPHDVEVTEGD